MSIKTYRQSRVNGSRNVAEITLSFEKEGLEINQFYEEENRVGHCVWSLTSDYHLPVDVRACNQNSFKINSTNRD